MKGKKFISTVKVIKPIDGILEVGGLYKTDDLKRKFPFLDLNNKEYFETQYYDKFKKGDKVRFVAKNENEEYIYNISTKKVYYVKDVLHEIYILSTQYTPLLQERIMKFSPFMKIISIQLKTSGLYLSQIRNVPTNPPYTNSTTLLGRTKYVVLGRRYSHSTHINKQI